MWWCISALFFVFLFVCLFVCLFFWGELFILLNFLREKLGLEKTENYDACFFVYIKVCLPARRVRCSLVHAKICACLLIHKYFIYIIVQAKSILHACVMKTRPLVWLFKCCKIQYREINLTWKCIQQKGR